jgi:hypothetical protein
MEVTCSHFSFLNSYRTEPDRITPVSFSWHYHDLQLRTRSVASRVFGSRHVETPATPAGGDIVWNAAYLVTVPPDLAGRIRGSATGPARSVRCRARGGKNPVRRILTEF